jgi:hypothetical protein
VIARAAELDGVDTIVVDGHLAKLRSVIADRRRYVQILA